MKRRPWPIVALAICQLLAPPLNILLNSYLFKLSPLFYLEQFMQSHSWLELFHLFLLFPLAGYAIYACKRWSLYLFLSIQAWTLYWNFQQLGIYPEVFTPALLLITYLVNITLVVYFLRPAVREIYANPRLRWWETSPRFDTHIKARLTGEWGEQWGEITNLSEGGILIKTSQKLHLNDTGTLTVSDPKGMFTIRGRVVHNQDGSSRCFGVQFYDLGDETRSDLKKLLRSLAGQDSGERPKEIELSPAPSPMTASQPQENNPVVSAPARVVDLQIDQKVQRSRIKRRKVSMQKTKFRKTA